LYSPEGYDGIYNNEDGELEAYWFFNDEQDGGAWIKENGLSTGEWYYDDGTTESGTWSQNGEEGGTWYQDANDSTLRIGSSYSDEEDQTGECYDTNNGATDNYGDTCDDYAANPSWCGMYDTDIFITGDMCCGCGGGSNGDDTSDDDDTSTDGTYGTVYDEDDSWIALWYLNQTDTEDGYWNDIYEETSGYWTYDDDSTESGTWWHVNYTSQGTWYTSTSDSTVKHIVETEADADGYMKYGDTTIFG
jgi:hypothetical protein